MNKQALLEETYRSAFEDELEKIADVGTLGWLLNGAFVGSELSSKFPTDKDFWKEQKRLKKLGKEYLDKDGNTKNKGKK